MISKYVVISFEVYQIIGADWKGEKKLTTGY